MVPDLRSLVVTLVLGAEGGPGPTLSVRELIESAALFGHAENAVRVAVARATAAGLLVAPSRGLYALGPAARPVADEVGRWRRIERQTVDWTGGWVAVHVGAIARGDRAALRARERAFGLLGLAELERGLHLRPDNLVGGVAALRERLDALMPDGAEPGTVFALRELSSADLARAGALWDGLALDAAYRDGTARLAAWLDDAHALPLERAARESWALGNDAIRRLVFDPLLPAPLVDTGARARYGATVARFDAAGKAIWRRFLAEVRATAA